MNTPPIIRTSLSFGSAPDRKLEDAAAAVLANLYGNPAFATPPVPQTELASLLLAFQDALAAMAQGGTAATAAKNNKRVELIAKLKELAFYVQVESDNDLALLLSSGFQAMSTNRSREPLAAPVIERIVPGQTGELLVTVTAIANARGYEVEVAPVTGETTIGPWGPAGFHSGSRRMSVGGLTRGSTYAFRVRAMGGSTGQSDWGPPTTGLSL